MAIVTYFRSRYIDRNLTIRHLWTYRNIINSLQAQNENILGPVQCSRFMSNTSLLQGNSFLKHSACGQIWNVIIHHKSTRFSSNFLQPKRFYSKKDNGDEEESFQKEVRILPRRILKRLQKQNITESEFLIKLNANNSRNDAIDRTSEPELLSINSKEELQKLLETTKVTPNFSTKADMFPSDMEKFQQWKKEEKLSSNTGKPKISPSKTSVILFPGQGSQFVGMGKQLLDFPGVHDLFDEASSLLGYDLLELCLSGPKDKLDQTVYCQPAILITSLAAIEKLREEHPHVVENCIATAGFSVGEFAALVFSGVISFPDAVKLVKVRAEAMQKASEAVSSGMLTVLTTHNSDLKGAMKMAREYCITRHKINEPVCRIANYLFPGCKVLAGHSEALQFIATNAKEFRLLRARRIPVSGAFHTGLMNSARKPFERAFQDMKLGTIKIPTYSNVTSHVYHHKTNFVHMLGQQILKPVLWEQIMHHIYKRPKGEEFPHTYEVGPGKQLGTLLKHINAQAHLQYHQIEV